MQAIDPSLFKYTYISNKLYHNKFIYWYLFIVPK